MTAICTTPPSHRKPKSNVESDAVPIQDDRQCTEESGNYVFGGDFRVEDNRMCTFTYFSLNSPVKIWDLARSGFFHLGIRDRVQCFSCGNCIENFILADDPFSSMMHYQDCTMNSGEDESNVARPERHVYAVIRKVHDTLQTVHRPTICREAGDDEQENDYEEVESASAQEPGTESTNQSLVEANEGEPQVFDDAQDEGDASAEGVSEVNSNSSESGEEAKGRDKPAKEKASAEGSSRGRQATDSPAARPRKRIKSSTKSQHY